MLQSLKALTGNRLQSEDEVFGDVDDFLFDDREWRIRFVVANTRRLLPGRKVVIPLCEVGIPGSNGRLPVALSKSEVKASLPLKDAGSGDRRHIAELHGHFGWFPSRVGAVPPATSVRTASDHPQPIQSSPSGSQGYHLCSARDTGRYVVESIEGESGYPEDFVFESESWVIRYIVAAVRVGASRGRVFIPTDRIRTVRHLEGKILTGVWREPITGMTDAPMSDVRHRESQREISHNPLFDFNGRPRFWM